MISCPNGCPVSILKHDMEEHVSKECLHRLIECSLCYDKFQLNQQQSHFEVCPMVSIPCRHCGENLPRQEIEQHLRNNCPKAVVLCPFVDVGCDDLIHPEHLQEHLVTHVHKHLWYVSSAHNRLQIAVANLAGLQDADVAGGGGLLSPLKTARDALENLNLNQQQESPKLSPERKISTPGESDLRAWFRHNIKLEQVMTDLEIKHNKLNHRMAEVETELAFLHEQRAANEGRFCNGVYVWRVPRISDLISQASQTGLSQLSHSPGFYTGAFGYKLCLRLNVTARQNASFLSLFIHFMQGDYDDTLEWPFKGVITLAVIESRRGAEHQPHHIVETMTTKPGLAAFERPISDRNRKGFGFTEFVNMEHVMRGLYIVNDTLTVRAMVVYEPDIQYN